MVHDAADAPVLLDRAGAQGLNGLDEKVVRSQPVGDPGLKLRPMVFIQHQTELMTEGNGRRSRIFRLGRRPAASGSFLRRDRANVKLRGPGSLRSHLRPPSLGTLFCAP